MGDWGSSGAVVDNFYLERGMTDRELLELAAKAAGYVVVSRCDDGRLGIEGLGRWWHPLTDDGDALRLAVKLHFSVKNTDIRTSVLGHDLIAVTEAHGDPYAATRRAIVRAAAEIGKELE